MEQLEGKVALITGSSSGIGVGIAKVFVARGAKVMLTGRRQELLEAEAKQLGQDKVAFCAGDITDCPFQKQLVDATVKKFGKLHILVNNAGAGFDRAGLQDEPEETWETTMLLNVTALRQMSKVAIPHLKETKGNIINISSVAGLRPNAVFNAYAVSKTAVNQFTQCLAVELADAGVRVNCICPAVIETNFAAALMKNTSGKEVKQEETSGFYEMAKKWHPLGRNGQPEEIGYAAAFLASYEAAFITGAILPVDGGLVCERRQ